MGRKSRLTKDELAWVQPRKVYFTASQRNKTVVIWLARMYRDYFKSFKDGKPVPGATSIVDMSYDTTRAADQGDDVDDGDYSQS